MATGLLDYLEAAGETGATLGSGAAATLAGIPYGILQNIRSGKYGTKEGVKLADKATQDFIKQYTYAPRGQMAQNALQSVAGLLESTKLPPVLPEAGLLAAIPKATYASQFERAGMAAERAMEPVAANVMARGGLPAQLLQDLTQGTTSNVTKRQATVMNPERIAFPNIYKNPKELVQEATSRVAPENPLLQQLFGVTRQDLFDISQQGTRAGNITDVPFKTAKNPKGAAHASQVMNPRNEQRLQDIVAEARLQPELFKGMASWYTMDPLYQRFVDIYGQDKAIGEYNKFNALTGMSSPGSEVLTELNRGTAANMMDTLGRFEDFRKYGGVSEFKRGADYPPELAGVIGHPYHSTAQAGPMGKYLASGLIEMDSAKVPSYIHASGVPETGFQTQYPVGDAHWSRLVGLPDVRGATTKKGVPTIPKASASVPEMVALGPWFNQRIAQPMGLEAVPTQAVIWGAGSGATGVTSPIGAPKLELLAQQIGETATRLGISPETARDMIIRGQAYAGGITKGGLLSIDD